jgi:hypothetical protein
MTRCVCKGLCGLNHSIQCPCDGIEYQMGLCRPCQKGLDAEIAKQGKSQKRRELPASPRMSDGFGDTPLFGGKST